MLRYLARVAEGASFPQARASVPLLLRGLVEARARAHAVAAGFETAHADDTAHVHRLAYLRARHVPAASDEPAWVARAFAEHRDLGAERRAFVGPTIALLLVFTLAGAAGGLAWWRGATSAATPRATAQPELPSIDELFPPEAREDEHPLRAAFARAIPAYTVALDARSRDQEPPAPDDVASRRAQVIDALGRELPALLPSTNAVLDAAEAYVATRGDDTYALDGWFNALASFHDALEREGAPFHLDAELTRDLRTGRRRVLVSTYRVLARRVFRAGDERVRQIDIERLDTLNYDQSLLGYTRPEARHALVRRDRIERFLVEHVLPSVHGAEESVIVRDYADEVGIEWVTDFEGWAHEDLRAEAQAAVARAIDPRSTGLRDLAAAITRRRNAVRQIEGDVRAAGVRVRLPNRYAYDVSRLAGLGAGTSRWLVEAREAEASLRSAPVRRAYDAVHEAFGLSIAEHEVQHRLDYEDGRLAEVPDVLARYVGETESEDRVNRRAERSNAELSAYLSQIAQRPAMARTSLIHVASFLMDRRSWSMPEAYAAVALFEALAREARIAHEPLIARRRIQRAQVARIYGALRASHDGPALSALAGRTWTTLYGAPIPAITLERGPSH
ncbi:MAG: hypothetical protein KF729_26260 [Sandaracinaceae bacterium]|nr:hypothetical protein [Sandaracinaceae bacterium]